MANFTISGNVGGTSGSGATVQLSSRRGTGVGTGYAADIFQTAIADASGNFTFTVPDLRSYVITVIPTGANVCRVSHEVILNGANVSNVNFQISALNSDNRGPLGF
jgi:hypothetical protein